MKAPCSDFSPDSLGDDPAVCIGCLWHVSSHSTPFAAGWQDGYEGWPDAQGDRSAAWSANYAAGLAQGKIDAARIVTYADNGDISVSQG
jgi:hypothetical protein